MITYREYCKRLNERKSEDCQIREDWGTTSPIPKEKYADVDWRDNFKWIDLGLPSGTLWADTNLENLENKKDFWGFEEVITSTYKDHLPTRKQFLELLKNCKWKWDAKEMGVYVTGENGNSIFLPARGYEARNIDGIWCPHHTGREGAYWSSSLQTPPYTYILTFAGGKHSTASALNDDEEGEKMSVRLVKNKN